MTNKHDRIFKCPETGRPDSAPWTPEQAVKHGRAAYKDHDGCANCDTRGPKMRYVTTNECVGCFTRSAHDAWDTWVQGNPSRPNPFCRTPEEAIQAGQTGYYNCTIHPLVCTGGPHFRVTSVENSDVCMVCQMERDLAAAVARGPRANARRDGHREYMPTEPCPDCGAQAVRDVVTNRCNGCPPKQRGRPPGPARAVVPEAAPDGRRSPTTIMIEAAPADMVLTRDDARAYGFTQYRTGEPCRRGHTGWRYVSVGNCVQCLRGEA